MRWILLVLTVAASLPAAAGEVQLNGHTFTLPDGFEIELVAGPPLADRPIVADFDEQGRLYVADSSGSNEKVDTQLAEKPHRILRLEDTDGDGRFDKSIVFADRMMFPAGVMWLDGSLYVATPPSIWKLTDTDGDGVADQRAEWFAGKTVTGCANDLHGPYAGPDGWIYWCKGAFAKQTYERVGKTLRVIPDLPVTTPATQAAAKDRGATPHPPLDPHKYWSTRASHIFRCRPDGSQLEPVMTGGMDNPVDVAFAPGGERIFSTTFLQQPAGGRRDGLIHAVYGGVYGKVHDVIEEHKRTGDIMPVLAHLGPAAACGLARYESRGFGDEYQDNLFACCFNLHKVTRHVLEPDGGTFRTRDCDFLVSNNLDFHPTDVLEDADGSLIVVDTGGWYKLCCPTSQLWKPDVLGGIYRVRRKGAPRIDDPRGLKITWSALAPRDLVRWLGDGRPVVRRQAIRQLAERAGDSVAALSAIFSAADRARPRTSGGVPDKSSAPSGPGAAASIPARLGAVWALTRIDGADARAAVRAALADPDDTVRQAALHSISLRRDRDAAPQLLELLEGGSARSARGAAEALGRIGDGSAVPALLAAAARVSRAGAAAGLESPGSEAPAQRVLEHSLIFALIEIADPAATAAGLASDDRGTRRAALMALDQMDGGGLDPHAVAPLLGSAEPVLKETAAWIVAQHPEWGEALAGVLKQRLHTPNLAAADRTELERQLARFARNPSIVQLLAACITGASPPRGARLVALGAMRESGLKEMPRAWLSPLAQTLAGDDVEQVRAAVAAVRSLPLAKGEDADELRTALLRIARSETAPVAVRLDALAAVPNGLAGVEPDVFDFLRAQLSVENAVSARTTAADVLGRARLSSEQLDALTDALRTAGPLEVNRLLAAYEQSTDEKVGLDLVAALKVSSALAGLRPDALKPRLAKYDAAVQAEAQALYAVLNADAASQKERIDQMLAAPNQGDVRRGQAVFQGSKAACSSCHAMGYLGGSVGPDLTRIGSIRSERDLLESIVFPSASFVRSYEPVVVATTAGQVYSGVLTKDAADEVVLATSATETMRIARDELEEMRPGTISVMPSGLDQQLTPQELADLVAFLKAAK